MCWLTSAVYPLCEICNVKVTQERSHAVNVKQYPTLLFKYGLITRCMLAHLLILIRELFCIFYGQICRVSLLYGLCNVLCMKTFCSIFQKCHIFGQMRWACLLYEFCINCENHNGPGVFYYCCRVVTWLHRREYRHDCSIPFSLHIFPVSLL